MLLDATRIEARTLRRHRVCIVGSGIAGSCLALELSQLGLDVLLLEAGGIRYSKASQREFSGEVEDPRRHPNLECYRERRLGGTSSVWGGRCAPFSQIDFEKRSYIPHSGWPLVRSDYDGSIERAHLYMSLGAVDYEAASALLASQRHQVPGWSGTPISDASIWRFSLPTRFEALLAADARMRPNLTVLYNAPVTRIVTDPSGHVVIGLEITTDLGRTVIPCDQVALCAGTLETTRLLLASNDVAKGGLGNGSGLLGRFYMSHHYGTAGWIRVPSPRQVISGFTTTVDGVYARHMFRPTNEMQRQEELLNISFGLDNPSLTDPGAGSAVLSGMFFAKSILRRSFPAEMVGTENPNGASVILRHARNVVRGIPELVGFAPHWIGKRILAKRKVPGVFIHSRSGTYRVSYSAEQSPCFESRLSLSAHRDRRGMPKLKVDWRYNESDVEKIARSIGFFEQAAIAAGAEFKCQEGDDLRRTVESSFSVGSHQIGTTRMSDRESDGVVDRNCKVFGLQNLYVASASVFPTSSYANPSLMIAATALKVGDAIRQQS